MSGNIIDAVLLSGGQDSIALAYWKRPKVAISVDYGQRSAEAELGVSRQISDNLGIEHHIISVEAGQLFSGSMFGGGDAIRADLPEWTPFRNQFLVTIAAMFAVKRGVNVLMSGQVRDDQDFVDGRVEFEQAMASLLKIQEGGITYQCPGISMRSVELIEMAKVPKSILALAHSCHRSNRPCGECRGCNKHDAVLRELGWY